MIYNHQPLKQGVTGMLPAVLHFILPLRSLENYMLYRHVMSERTVSEMEPRGRKHVSLGYLKSSVNLERELYLVTGG